MNILFDTNVLFSALGFQGVPGKLLEVEVVTPREMVELLAGHSARS